MVVMLVLTVAECALPAPGPGDVYREYHWRPEGKWQRVTGPEVEDDRAKAFLPNAVNHVGLADLDRAVRAEITLEMLLCHGGTIDKRVRINGSRWLAIPESPHIPGTAGRGPPEAEYQYMRYPTLPVDLDLLKAGDNTFEFTCRGGSAIGGWWPQWIVYGVTFRIYYGPDKPHHTARISDPRPGDTLGENAAFQVDVREPSQIERVDFIGRYEDFNWEGDGLYRQWHYRTLFGELHNHVGTAREQPYRVRWDNEWVPDQDEPIEVVARVVDRSGLCYVTPAIGGLRLARHYSVKMYKPLDVPKLWSSRTGQKDSCKVNVPDDPATAQSARVTMSTWNGVVADEIGVNDRKVVRNVGLNHDLSYDSFPVPPGLIKQGTNTLYTFSDTEHHGIEVQWPGMVLLIRY